MTNREFFVAIVNSNVSDELKAFALEAINKLDARNASRSSKPSKAAIANEPIKETIIEYLRGGYNFKTSFEIEEATGIPSTKVRVLCTQLVNDGKLEKTDVKVPKKGTVKAYRCVDETEEE